jgi:hypothetical protein
MKTWHAFAYLIVAGTIWYFLKGPLVVIGLVVGPLAGLGGCAHRFPQTTYWCLYVLSCFLDGGRGRRRRW